MKNVIFLTLLSVFALLIFFSVSASKKARLRRRKALREEFGAVTWRDLSPEELLKIRFYFDEEKDSGISIDDITASDLDFDRFFRRVDQTHSGPGEEVLYRLLRMPERSEAELKKRKEVMDFFTENEEVRLSVSEAFFETGKTKLSLLSYLSKVKELPFKNSVSDFLPLFFLFVTAVIFVFHIPFGILAFVLTMIFDFAVYFKKKSAYDQGYVSVALICRLVAAGLRISEKEIRGYETEMREIREELSVLRKLKTASFFLGNLSDSGNILHLLTDYVRIFTNIDFILFSKMVGMIIGNEDKIRGLYEKMGKMEALISMASYRKSLPYAAEPERTSANVFTAEELYHPLLKTPVGNSLSVSEPVLLTGSNASGKSTFLRTVGISLLLAESFDFVPAKSFKAPFYRIVSSMALRDDLQKGKSYYMAEIEAIRRILKSPDDVKTMVLLDEVLKGTNTVERIAAGTAILKYMAKKMMVFAATHDMELSGILSGVYRNYHFSESVGDTGILFDYQLRVGPSQTKNAILLLKAMDYPEEITEEAERKAARFLNDGIWEN